jgi:hypothetical protein
MSSLSSHQSCRSLKGASRYLPPLASCEAPAPQTCLVYGLSKVLDVVPMGIQHTRNLTDFRDDAVEPLCRYPANVHLKVQQRVDPELGDYPSWRDIEIWNQPRRRGRTLGSRSVVTLRLSSSQVGGDACSLADMIDSLCIPLKAVTRVRIP